MDTRPPTEVSLFPVLNATALGHFTVYLVLSNVSNLYWKGQEIKGKCTPPLCRVSVYKSRAVLIFTMSAHVDNLSDKKCLSFTQDRSTEILLLHSELGGRIR